MSLTDMRGATRVRDIVMSYIELTIPGLIEQARTQWELDTKTLPDVETYYRREPRTLSSSLYPAIACNVVQAGDLKLIDTDFKDGIEIGQQYKIHYQVRIYAWVRTPEYADDTKVEPALDETIRFRDDLGTLIRSAILLQPTLGNPLAYAERNTISEEYSDAEPVKGNRYICGVIVSFDLAMDEALTLKPVGIADTISVEPIHLLPVN